jgi:hypothetical protein
VRRRSSRRFSQTSAEGVLQPISSTPCSIIAHNRSQPPVTARRQVYRNDVMLQMVSKALGDEYNRLTKPPKQVPQRARACDWSPVLMYLNQPNQPAQPNTINQPNPQPTPTNPAQVDFVQASLVEFTGREGRPVCAIEDLIEGDYIKYNR